jgi:hypothetical protein
MGRKCIADRRRVLAVKILRVLASALLMAFLLAAMFLTSSPTPGHAQVPEELVLYQENFDDGQAQGWELEPGWVVSGNRLNGKNYALARYTAGDWGDGRVTLKFSLVSLQGDMHANFRMSDMGCYAIGFRYTEQSLAKEILYIYLFKKLGPDKVSSTLAQSTIHYDQGLKSIEIVTEGGKIQVYVSEASPELQPYRFTVHQEVPIVAEPPVVTEPPVMVIDYVDSAPLPCGTIAFETFEDSAAQIDDIIVTGPPVPCPPPSPPPPSTPPVPEGPDLIISSISYWFENDGRVLVLSTGIGNQGNVSTPETLVSIRDQDNEFPYRISLAPGLRPGGTTTLEIRRELSEEQRGTTHTFLFEVDPMAYILELDETNNRQTIDISVPVQEGGVPWYWIIPALLAGGAGFSLKRWSDRRQTNIPKKIQVRPQMDIGRQQIESASPIRLDFEIRLRPVLDHGKQDIEAKGPSIIDKRRQR